MKISFETLRSLFQSEETGGYRFENGRMVYRKSNSLFSVKLIAAAMVCLTAMSVLVYTTLRKDITIEDITGSKAITTFKSNVGDVLNETNIRVRPQDRINVSLEDKLTDGLKIKITRANNIAIAVDGKKVNIITTAPTVKAAIEEAKIKLNGKDKILPALNTKILGDASIKVSRVTEKVVKSLKTIEPRNIVIKKDKLDIGVIKVVKEGKSGKKEVSTKLIFEDGKQVASAVIGEKVLQQPVDGIVEEGTKATLITARGELRRFKKATYMTATAYDLSVESCGKSPSHPQYGITSSGLKVREGIVAVDPRVIPLGTWLYVEGYGEALAADTGGAIKGNKIDLFYSSSSKVNKFGRKKVKVYILDKPRYKF